MVEVHPAVQRLIDALLVSALPDLGRAALERVLDEDGSEAGLRPPGTDSPGPRERPARGTGLQQLEAAAAAVEGVLELELALHGRTRALLKEYRQLRASMGRGAAHLGLETVVVGDATGAGGEAAVFRGEDILSGARPEALLRLLEAWRAGVDEVRQELDPNGLV